jgi:SAM-dependent methyltransferase
MYDESIAIHYAAYRPPIHEIILERAIAPSDNQRLGLDIGCGTGRSSRALKKFCHLVVGLDPSEAMLRKAEKSERVLYVSAAGEQIPLIENVVDIVTIAGSLNYIDSAMLATELKRVCRSDAAIVVYDFEIDLSNIEEKLRIERPVKLFEYDHAANLCGLFEIKNTSVVDDVFALELNSSEVAHLLLAEKGRYKALHEKFPVHNLFDSLKNEIEAKESIFSVKANVYYSLYALQ